MAVVLYTDPQKCCGCGACMNACPRNAITMEENDVGFVYPTVNANLCVDCGICHQVCGYQNEAPLQEPVACYAAVAKDRELLLQSASGGVFAAVAQGVLKAGGVVYGSALVHEPDGHLVKHIRIEKAEELPALQGSKYVQSDTGTTYTQAKQDLLAGKQVVYSGTPCQIAGLKSFLGRNFDNLLTMDIICHGVPGVSMFNAFLETLGRRKNRTVTSFVFRSKRKGQGMNTCVSYMDHKNVVTE